MSKVVYLKFGCINVGASGYSWLFTSNYQFLRTFAFPGQIFFSSEVVPSKCRWWKKESGTERALPTLSWWKRYQSFTTNQLVLLLSLHHMDPCYRRLLLVNDYPSYWSPEKWPALIQEIWYIKCGHRTHDHHLEIWGFKLTNEESKW